MASIVTNPIFLRTLTLACIIFFISCSEGTNPNRSYVISQSRVDQEPEESAMEENNLPPQDPIEISLDEDS